MEAIKGKGQFFTLIPTNSIKPEFRRKGEQDEGVAKQHNLSQCGNDKDRNQPRYLLKMFPPDWVLFHLQRLITVLHLSALEMNSTATYDQHG